MTKWSWAVFFTKITSRKFWVWIVTTALADIAINQSVGHSWVMAVIIVWGVVSFVYLCGEAIVDAMGKAIERANIGIHIGGGYDGTQQKNTGGAGPAGPTKV